MDKEKDTSIATALTIMGSFAFLNSVMESQRITATFTSIIEEGIVGAIIGFGLTALFFIVQEGVKHF